MNATRPGSPALPGNGDATRGERDGRALPAEAARRPRGRRHRRCRRRRRGRLVVARQQRCRGRFVGREALCRSTTPVPPRSRCGVRSRRATARLALPCPSATWSSSPSRAAACAPTTCGTASAAGRRRERRRAPSRWPCPAKRASRPGRCSASAVTEHSSRSRQQDGKKQWSAARCGRRKPVGGRHRSGVRRHRGRQDPCRQPLLAEGALVRRIPRTDVRGPARQGSGGPGKARGPGLRRQRGGGRDEFWPHSLGSPAAGRGQ